MSSAKGDNVIRVDFRQGVVLGEGEEVEAPEAVEEEPGELVEAEETEPKHVTFGGLIEIGKVMVTLDTRAEGVIVPSQFANAPQLHLNFSHRFRIDDFEFDEDSVRATLSFDSGDAHCVVPWKAIYVMVCESADACHIYPTDFPPELQSVVPKLIAQLKRDGDPES